MPFDIIYVVAHNLAWFDLHRGLCEDKKSFNHAASSINKVGGSAMSISKASTWRLMLAARHREIGSMLMEATIAMAWAKGFKRIELTVRTDNHNAKALYERYGFVIEGLSPSAFCVDDEFFDALSMGLMYKPPI